MQSPMLELAMTGRKIGASVSLLLVALTICSERDANAQLNNFYAGTASNGQAVNVDLGSIRQVSATSLDFTYYLGNSRVSAQANCQGGFWVSFPEGQINKPQSGATQRMLSKVCSYLGGISSPTRSSVGAAFVFDPPSNIRSSPNGAILCSVRTRTYIDVYGRSGQWHATDFCGSPGYIHQNQLRF
jgi:hypothetical protein